VNEVTKIDRLLIVDDEKNVADTLRNISCNLGYAVKVADNIATFRKLERDFDPTVILLDLQMHGNDGVEYLKVLAKQKSSASIIVLSDTENRTSWTTSQLGSVLGLQMAAMLQKPISIHALRRELRKLMHGSTPLTAARLSAAIKVGQVRPHFQPKVTRSQNGSWQVGEVEALARWYRSDGSIVLPDNFIELAEDSGLLGGLTDSMLQQVADQLGRWNKQGHRVRAAVNLSPTLLTDRKLPDRLERLLGKHGVENNQLILEVTEQVVIEHTQATIGVLSRLRAKNIGLAIDDFGTGYSSLEQLYRMPFDELKIDHSLIRRCQSNKDIRTIIEAIVILGQKLGMTVCAEGVETADAFEFISGTGCDKQQGYLIGKPVPAAELEMLIGQTMSDLRATRAIA